MGATGLGSPNFQKFAAIFPTTPPSPSPEARRASSPIRAPITTSPKNQSAGRPSKSPSMPAVMRSLGWSRPQRSSPETFHELLFTLRQRNMDRLEEMLLDRSNPESPRYGRWLSRDEVKALTVDKAAEHGAREFLKRSGVLIVGVTSGGQFMR